MADEKLYDYLGKKYRGVEVPFKTEGEQWTSYNLEDGSSAKIKIVLMEMIRLVDAYTDAGEPVYVFTAQQVVGIKPNPNLVKKVQ